jgi:hypothetical protein
MKLYEFVYADNQNLPESKLLARVKEFLENEKTLQGWAPDYQFQQCREVEQLASGERNFYFEVSGRYLDDESMSFDEERGENSSSSPSAAAASPDTSP